MVNRDELSQELIRRRNQVSGNIPGPTGNYGIRRLDDDEGNVVYSSPPIIPPQIQNRLTAQNTGLPFNEQVNILPQNSPSQMQMSYGAFNVIEVKKINSPLLKVKIKEWFEFCLSSEHSFKETMLYYNIVSKEKTFEMLYNTLEETAFVEMEGDVVQVKTKDVNDVLNKLIFTKSQLASLTVKPMFVGEPVPFIKVSGYDEFLVGRKLNSIILAKRIVNALNFLSSVPDEMLERNDEIEIIEFLIRLNQQKVNTEKAEEKIEDSVEIDIEQDLTQERESGIIKPKRRTKNVRTS